MRPDLPGDAICTQCHGAYTGARLARHTKHAGASTGSGGTWSDEESPIPISSKDPVVGPRNAPVTVVICQHHQERALLPHEEGRRPVAEPLARLRKGEADLAELRQHLLPFPLCGAAHALVIAEVDDQP